jgi:hypothetical protein
MTNRICICGYPIKPGVYGCTRPPGLLFGPEPVASQEAPQRAELADAQSTAENGPANHGGQNLQHSLF